MPCSASFAVFPPPSLPSSRPLFQFFRTTIWGRSLFAPELRFWRVTTVGYPRGFLLSGVRRRSGFFAGCTKAGRFAPANSLECAANVEIARMIFHRFVLPLNPTKCEGPTPRLFFLGIELDSVAQMARLPEAKFSATQVLLLHWQSKQWCSRTELESLIGTLHHVCKVIPPSRSFLP